MANLKQGKQGSPNKCQKTQGATGKENRVVSFIFQKSIFFSPQNAQEGTSGAPQSSTRRGKAGPILWGQKFKFCCKVACTSPSKYAATVNPHLHTFSVLTEPDMDDTDDLFEVNRTRHNEKVLPDLIDVVDKSESDL